MPFLILIIKKRPSFLYNINNLNKPAEVRLSPVISAAKIALVRIRTIDQKFSRSMLISFILSFSSLFIRISLVVIIITTIYNFLVNKALKAIVITVL